MSDGGRIRDDGRTSGPADVGAVFASPRRRLLAFAVFQTAGVVLLANVAFWLVGSRSPDALSHSGHGAVLTKLVLDALVLTSLGLYIAVPVAVAWYVATRSDRHWLAGVAWAGGAVLVLPWLATSLALLVPGGNLGDPLLGVLVLVGGLALVVAADRLAAERTPAEVPTKPPRVVSLALLVAVGYGLGALVAVSYPFVFQNPTPPDGLVEEAQVGMPTVAFDFDYEATGDGRGVLAVTHAGGTNVVADSVFVRGSGFADVAGADLTGPGRWADDEAGVYIGPGDSVTVGVTSDCTIRIVWGSPGGGTSQVLGRYECGGGAGASDDASLEPSRLGGGR